MSFHTTLQKFSLLPLGKSIDKQYGIRLQCSLKAKASFEEVAREMS